MAIEKLHLLRIKPSRTKAVNLEEIRCLSTQLRSRLIAFVMNEGGLVEQCYNYPSNSTLFRCSYCDLNTPVVK